MLLHDSRTDADGLPAPKVHYRISENTRRNLKFTVERMVESHQAAGAVGRSRPSCGSISPGTCSEPRGWATTPRTSVVDSYGRTHDVANLYIADGSIFVTGGSANPTCTISALALRVGQAIADGARNQEVAS